MQVTFVILLSILLAVYLVQDTAHLPPLNNQRQMVKHLGWTKILLGTVLMSGGIAYSLWVAIRYSGQPLPLGEKIFYLVFWTMSLLGMFDSWYRPYFSGPKPKDLDDYARYHSGTHTLLPARNGYPGPNTFHLTIVHPLGVACAVLGCLKVAGAF
jgi:hypothetical protein